MFGDEGASELGDKLDQALTGTRQLLDLPISHLSHSGQQARILPCKAACLSVGPSLPLPSPPPPYLPSPPRWLLFFLFLLAISK